jgi:hypothetical protein
MIQLTTNQRHCMISKPTGRLHGNHCKDIQHNDSQRYEAQHNNTWHNSIQHSNT